MDGSKRIEQVSDQISSLTFHVLTWIFFALCIIAFAVRAYIRYVCFHRLLFEDYLILLALLMHSTEAILIQIYIPFVYKLESVQNGEIPGPNFFSVAREGFVGVGTGILITIFGVLIIKLNFLLFFRRLGTHISKFNFLWWSVLVFTVAGTITQVGTLQFGCFFGDVNYIFSQCSTPETNKRSKINSIYSSVVDALSDFLIIALPVAILWTSRINRRQKYILSGIFSLVFITIAVTIVRGSVFHAAYNSEISATGTQTFPSLTFTWFWFYTEFTVAFLIACIVSFRSLFVHRETNVNNLINERQRQESARRNAIHKGWRLKAQNFHESILDTCRTMEGWTGSEAELLTMNCLSKVPSGLMTVDFNDDANWTNSVRGVTRDGQNSINTLVKQSDAADSLPRSS
ncbi:hypothetical protein F4782DRAFT_41077 [Xylaria castorea]|nr:hypothetical protein F4782DRAFT_41077 [Xylaria castorea]